MTDRYAALDHARRHARSWLDSLATRPAPPQASVAEVTKALGTEWAVLRALGRRGVAELVERLCAHAAAFAGGIAAIDGARVVHDVVFTPGLRDLRRRRAHRRGHPRPARRRHRLDVRLPLARPDRAPGIGQQLVYHR